MFEVRALIGSMTTATPNRRASRERAARIRPPVIVAIANVLSVAGNTRQHSYHDHPYPLLTPSDLLLDPLLLFAFATKCDTRLPH
jgi:hypothetical protein